MKELLIFLADGFEEIEALTLCDYLRRAEISVELVSIMTDRHRVKGAHGIEVIADKHISEISIEDYKGVYIPGGLPGAVNLANENRVVEIVKMYQNSEDNYVAAICAGPIVFDRAGILKDGNFTCYPGFEKNLSTEKSLNKAVVQDKNIFTSMGPSFAQVLAFEIIKYLKGEEKAEEIKSDVLFNRLVDFVKKDEIN